MKLETGLVLGGIAAGAFLLTREAHAETTIRPGAGLKLGMQDESPKGMSGADFARSLPEKPSPEREARILAAVLSGDAVIRWGSVTSTFQGRTLVLPVLARALAIGSVGDAWRVICTFPTAQKIADELSCHMLTPKVADLIFEQADIRLIPMNRSVWVTDGSMGKTSRSLEQSQALDKLVPADGAGLVANEGKHWVITQRNFKPLGFDAQKWASPPGTVGSKHNGANYGWHQRSGKPLQPVGLAHDFAHTDYSQMIVLCSRLCSIDGEEHATEEVARGPLSALVSNEGSLPGLRHPDL